MTLHAEKFLSGKSGHSGQAMTEMVIAASFVLVPLFLLIPWLGKYIDLQQSAIQAARYEAWEYTVWYNDVTTEAPAGAKKSPNGPQIMMPEKSIAKLQEEARQRFFSEDAYSTDRSLSELHDDDKTNWDINITNPLWQDHLGNSLLSPTLPIGKSVVESSGDTPSNNTSIALKTPLEIDELIFNAATGAGGAIANLIGAGSKTPTFEIHNLKGYSHTEMEILIESQPGLVSFGTISGDYALGTTPNTVRFSIKSVAAVLSDGWNAGGRYHAKEQVGELTIARKLGSLSDKFTALSEYGAIKSSNHMGGTTTHRTPTGEFADLLECGELRGAGWGQRSPPDVFGQGGVPADDEDGSLWTGYVDMGAIHPDRLHAFVGSTYTVDEDHIGGSGDGHNCTGNTCKFTYNTSYQYPWADPAVDEHLVAPDDCIKIP